jgi:FAD:protein FMN transferase
MISGLHSRPREQGHCFHFSAFAGDCELLVEGLDENHQEAKALELAQLAYDEAQRVQDKFSRYNSCSILSQANAQAGQGEIEIEDEFAALLDFAKSCAELSEGLFDVTAGSLRKLWAFDAQENVLHEAPTLKRALSRVGFHRLQWRTNPKHPARLRMEQGMQLDFGGIGKEYAVDRVCALLHRAGAKHALINFGGDLAVTGPRADGSPWCVGLENAQISLGTPEPAPSLQLFLKAGAIATSGDTRRYFTHQGQRYCHILNPKTALPIQTSISSVSVAAPSCLQAGLLSTLAILKEDGAAAFLKASGFQHWIQHHTPPSRPFAKFNETSE